MKPQVTPHLLALTEGPNIPLDKPIVLIGRHQECDIQIPSRKISRRHCCIAQIADHLVVRDLGSTNGIRINGVKVVEGNLQAEDELTIGNARYQLKWEDDPGPAAAGSAKNGIKAGEPHHPLDPRGKAGPSNPLDSCDEPMLLPDMSLSKVVPQSKPAPPQNGDGSGLKIPSDVHLLPLDPPAPT